MSGLWGQKCDKMGTSFPFPTLLKNETGFRPDVEGRDNENKTKPHFIELH